MLLSAHERDLSVAEMETERQTRIDSFFSGANNLD